MKKKLLWRYCGSFQTPKRPRTINLRNTRLAYIILQIYLHHINYYFHFLFQQSKLGLLFLLSRVLCSGLCHFCSIFLKVSLKVLHQRLAKLLQMTKPNQSILVMINLLGVENYNVSNPSSEGVRVKKHCCLCYAQSL